MIKGALRYHFLFSVVIGMCIYVAQKTGVLLPDYIRFYVNDFLILPIVLTVSLSFLRWSRGDNSYIIPFGVILFLCTSYAIFFEYFLPKFHPRYTADSIDVLLYFVSGIVFYFLQKQD